MNKTAPTFFSRHEQLLIQHIILSIARVTDSRQSGSRKNAQDNLTLLRLLDLSDPVHQELRTDLQSRWKTISVQAEPMRQYRHKLLAHASLADRLVAVDETRRGNNDRFDEDSLE